jgi:hypothetical protein
MKAIFWDDDDKGMKFARKRFLLSWWTWPTNGAQHGRSCCRSQRRADEQVPEEGDLSEEEIKAGLRARTLASEIVPAVCGSAFKNKGVPLVLDAVIDFLPAPTEIPAIRVTDLIDAEEESSQSSTTSVLLTTRAVLGPGVQDCHRPVRGYSDLRPRLLGRPGLRRHRDQLGQGQERARRPYGADARQPA